MRARIALILAVGLGLATVVALFAGRWEATPPLTAFAAASLKAPLTSFDADASYSYAGSNKPEMQIESGAPADLFLSASPREPRALWRAGRCTEPVTFATNRIVLLVPQGNPEAIRSAGDLLAGGRRIAIGTTGVPVGDYARQLLARMELSSVLTANSVSRESDAGGVVAKVALGSADAGFVYASDAKAVAGRTDAVPLPGWAQPSIRYQGCVVKRPGGDEAGATAYLERLAGAEGRDVLGRYGFGAATR